MKIHPNSTCKDCVREDCNPKYYVGQCGFKEVKDETIKR